MRRYRYLVICLALGATACSSTVEGTGRVAPAFASLAPGTTSGGGDAGPSQRPVPSVPAPATTTPPKPPDLPPSVGDYSVVCGGKRAFADASAYTGAGPHPIAYSVVGTRYRGVNGHDFPRSPAGWETKDIRKAQLVACVSMRPGPRVTSCAYANSANRRIDVPMSWRDYSIDIRSTRTGLRVGPTQRFRAGITECPQRIIVYGGGTADPLFSRPTPAQFHSVFDRWVTVRR